MIQQLYGTVLTFMIGIILLLVSVPMYSKLEKHEDANAGMWAYLAMAGFFLVLYAVFRSVKMAAGW